MFNEHHRVSNTLENVKKGSIRWNKFPRPCALIPPHNK
jgi:hypothetical protein